MINKLKLKVISICCLGLVLYNSFYFQNLSELKKEKQKSIFSPEKYADEFWENLLNRNFEKAFDASILISLLKNDMKEALKYSNTIGVSINHSYLIKGEGKVTTITNEGLRVQLEDDKIIEITTDFIFGNAIRDASGMINVSDFPTTMEFNNISQKINDYALTNIITPFLSNIKTGERISFVGAAEVKEENPEIEPLKIIPIKLEVIKN